MNNNYKIEQMAKTRWFVTVPEKNAQGESLVVEISYVDLSESMMKAWRQAGLITKDFHDFYSFTTYVTDKNGMCRGGYNPTHKDQKIDFDWMFPASEENARKVFTEIIRRFMAA